MTITIKINTGNEAFTDDKDAEVSRIVARVAKDLECISPGVRHSLRDFNGNTVGSVTVRGK